MNTKLHWDKQILPVSTMRNMRGPVKRIRMLIVGLVVAFKYLVTVTE